MYFNFTRYLGTSENLCDSGAPPNMLNNDLKVPSTTRKKGKLEMLPTGIILSNDTEFAKMPNKRAIRCRLNHPLPHATCSKAFADIDYV